MLPIANFLTSSGLCDVALLNFLDLNIVCSLELFILQQYNFKCLQNVKVIPYLVVHFIRIAMSYVLISAFLFRSFFGLNCSAGRTGRHEKAVIPASGAMTPHRFSLNPFATSYIPLSRRETNRTFIAENSSNESIRANFPGYSEHNMHNPPYDNISPRLNMRHGEMAPVAIASPVQNHPFQGSLPHHISELTEMEIVDREFNKDVEFLRTIFPGLSEQSIADVFLANEGDMDATIEMLCQLEVFSLSALSFVFLLLSSTAVSLRVSTLVTNY